MAERVTVRGRALEVARWGAGAGPTILLLHEGLGCTALWRDFPVRLTAETGLPVAAYSRAGYGQSDAAPLPWPLDYMQREARETLGPLIDALALEEVILMGHSDGASIAAVYAGEMADPRVKGLILMAPHVFTEAMGLAEIAVAKTVYETTDMRAKMAKYHRDPDNAFRGWNDAWLDPAFQDWNIEDAILGISVPTLAIQGAGDQYGTLAQIDAIETAITAPFLRLVLPACRHAPHLEAPAATLDAVARFVETL